MIFFRNATTQSESSFWMEEISILAKNNRTPGILGHRVREVGEVQKCGVTPKITFFIFLGLWWVLYLIAATEKGGTLGGDTHSECQRFPWYNLASCLGYFQPPFWLSFITALLSPYE